MLGDKVALPEQKITTEEAWRVLEMAEIELKNNSRKMMDFELLNQQLVE